MKVLVTVPCYENIYPDTMKSIWDLKDATPDIELDFEFVRGYSVDRARNLCIHAGMKAGADAVLFVDNDMVFGKDFLANLLEWDEDVVMGYYDHRNQDGSDNGGRTNLCKTGQFNYIEQLSVEEMQEAKDEGYDLVEVKGGGLGFCLVKLDIFAKFHYPWFDFIEYGDGQCLSEDLFFAEQCRRAGIKIYADTRCYCGHIFRTVNGGAKWTK